MSTPLAVRLLTRCARPSVGRHSTYVILGVIGTLVGATITTLIAVAADRPPLMLACVLATPPIALVATIAAGRAGWMRRAIVFYEKAVVALLATALVLALADQPVLAGLDLAATGIAAFLAIGRLGCFGAACCHGKRARIGVRYGWEHAAGGFPKRWVGLPVFPIQLVDALAAACATAIAIAVAAARSATGTPLAAVACTYGAARFAIEFARGDAGRRYIAGTSVPQWMAVATTAAAALARPVWWSIATAATLAAGSLVLAVARRHGWWPHLWLVAPQHLVEIDALLARLIADGPAATTSAGLHLSLHSRPEGGFVLALALAGGPLAARTVRAIVGQLGRDWTVIESPSGTPARCALVRGVAREVLAS